MPIPSPERNRMTQNTAPESTPEQLVAGIARRDEAMFGRFYDDYAPQLYGIISEIVPDPATATEILREIFVRLWKAARHIDTARVSVMAWLTLTARAHAVDRRRRESGLQPLARASLQSLFKFDSWLPSPEDISQIDSRHRLLEKIVCRLPKAQSRLVELAVFKGYAEAEIAAQVGEPPGKVESELRAGLRFLRHRLRAVLGKWSANI
jgi:RNA polymerase sigma-70 factor, ECF subfamily